MKSSKSLTFEDLTELRERTEALSQFLEKQLKGYLEALRPLFAPKRLLGRHVGSREEVSGEDRTLAQLQEKYKEVCRTPFALPIEWYDGSLTALDNRLELCPWEYTYEAKGDENTKMLTITSPLRWVLTYASGYSLAQMRQVVNGKIDRRQEAVRQFVVNALVMHFLLNAYPALLQVLQDLRYQVSVEPAPGLGTLPLVTIAATLPTFCPPDSLLLKATRFSGVPAFIELIDLDSIQTLQDPLRLRLEQAAQIRSSL